MTVGVWNVEGLKKKLANDRFIEFIETFDLLALSETWMKGSECVNVCNMKGVFKGSEIRGKRGRYPGGVALLYQNRLHCYVQEIDILLNGATCIHLKAGGLEVCFLSIYRQPTASRYANPNFFVDLADTITYIRDKFPFTGLIILGDFNCRIGSENINIMRGDEDKRGDCRNSKDKILNAEGRELLSFCEAFELEIMNGKYGDDINGELTYINGNGCSVIDFVICTQDIIQVIRGFTVLDRVESHHSPIKLTLDIGSSNPCINEKEIPVLPIERFRWKEELRAEFIKCLSNKLTALQRNDLNADQIIRNLTGSIQEAGNRMKVRLREKDNEHKNTGWYNNFCRRAKKQVETALLIFRREGGEEN